MRTFALLAVAVLAAAAAQEKAPKEPTGEPAKRVKELQKERIATLKEAADVSQKLAQSARLEVRVALEDRMALLKAELDAAEKEADRVALYKETLDSLKGYEELAQAQKEAGRGTALAVLRVKARRLEVEIELERAKAKGAKK